LGVDGRLTAVTILAAAAATLVFALVPAWRASRPGVADGLRDGTRSTTAGSVRSRLRRGLVMAEVAIVLPLLVASGLAALAAHRFAFGAQGYEPDGALRARMILPAATYPDAAAQLRFVDDVLAHLARDPAVAAAATTTVLPASASNMSRELRIAGEAADPARPIFVNYRAVSPEYLPVVGIPLVRGRHLSAADRDGSEPVAVISRAMAARFWPNADPLGARIHIGQPGDARRIVGIVGDTIDDWFGNRRVPTAYVPVAQAPHSIVNLVLRGRSSDLAPLSEAARRGVAAVDADQALFDVISMRDAVHVRTTGLRFVGGLMAGFGVLALALAAVGLYTVMASHVTQRRREIGIRMALGARAGDVVRETLWQGCRMALVGMVVGLAIAAALARVMENALFGVVAIEPWLFASIAGILATVAVAASVLPARQAAGVDPVVAIRE
jgi:predicted permease